MHGCTCSLTPKSFKFKVKLPKNENRVVQFIKYSPLLRTTRVFLVVIIIHHWSLSHFINKRHLLDKLVLTGPEIGWQQTMDIAHVFCRGAKLHILKCKL